MKNIKIEDFSKIRKSLAKVEDFLDHDDRASAVILVRDLITRLHVVDSIISNEMRNNSV